MNKILYLICASLCLLCACTGTPKTDCSTVTLETEMEASESEIVATEAEIATPGSDIATSGPALEILSDPKNEPSNPAVTPITDCIPLYVQDGVLTDGFGNPVQLQGISSHGIAWFPEYVNQDSLHQMKEEWNCNVFRIAMYTDEYNGYCVSDDSNRQTLKDIIDRGVQAAIAEDMYVIIDWHVLHDCNPLKYKEQAMVFFDEMATKYADIPNVIYEICNEPNNGTSWEDVKAYALEVIPVIRSHSPESVILIGTPTWCQDIEQAAANPISEYENIMYTVHFYAATHKEDLRSRVQTAAQNGLPMFVSEFGISESSGNGMISVEEANQWLSLLNEYNISYCMWDFCNKDESAAFISSSCNKTSGFTFDDLTESGKWFVNRNSSNLAMPFY